jgi:hypothetical protein
MSPARPFERLGVIGLGSRPLKLLRRVIDAIRVVSAFVTGELRTSWQETRGRLPLDGMLRGLDQLMYWQGRPNALAFALNSVWKSLASARPRAATVSPLSRCAAAIAAG